MSAGVAEAAAALAGGGVVVLPTDTVYGLAARHDRPEAIARIYELKGRPPDKALQLLVPDASWLARLGRSGPLARALAGAFWPGALTIVVESLAGGGTVGLRVPDHALARAVLAEAGPLAATSANRSGEPTPADPAAIEALFGDGVDVYLDGGVITGKASSVVEVIGGDVRVSREGAVATVDIMGVLGESI